MPSYVIEREIPNSGQLSPAELRAVSQKSCNVLAELGTGIQWVQSNVVDDKVYCVYIAPDEDLVREHAQKGGFPANKVSQSRPSLIRRRASRRLEDCISPVPPVA